MSGMKALLCASLLFVLGAVQAMPLAGMAAHIKQRAVSQSVFDDMKHFLEYASAAYQPACASPLGNTLVITFDDPVTDTQGYIARDDNRKEIVAAFRGSQQPVDFFIDFTFALVPYISPGVTDTGAALVHAGFLQAYNSVASTVISTVQSQIDAYPDYTIVTSGHSLGGALSSLAGVSLKSNFANNNVSMYTYGQPRTGDANYATLAESRLGTSNIFRSVHTSDGVPTLIPTAFGYRHHATEYWQNPDPATPETVKQCSGGEDPTCSASIPSNPFNGAHSVYYNENVGSDPTLCA